MLLCQAHFGKKGKTAVTIGKCFKLQEKVGGKRREEAAAIGTFMELVLSLPK